MLSSPDERKPWESISPYTFGIRFDGNSIHTLYTIRHAITNNFLLFKWTQQQYQRKKQQKQQQHHQREREREFEKEKERKREGVKKTKEYENGLKLCWLNARNWWTNLQEQYISRIYMLVQWNSRSVIRVLPLMNEKIGHCCKYSFSYTAIHTCMNPPYRK